MDNVLKLHPNTVIDHLTHCHDNADQSSPDSAHATLAEDINWVLSRWPNDSVQPRALTDESYRLLKGAINQVPTGKQKHYRQALNAILIYLSDIAQWQLPKRTERLFIDRNLAWFNRLSEQAELAYTLWQAYQLDKSAFLQTRTLPTSAQAALTIAIEVAPLSLSYLAALLADSNALERTELQSTLKVVHWQRRSASTEQEDSAFTRYHLTLYSYCFLDTYYQRAPQPLTARQLCNALNDYIATAPYNLGKCSAAQWHYIFQILWHYRDNVPPTLLKDMAQPERHVDFDAVSLPPTQKNRAISEIYQQDWLTDKKLAQIVPTSKPRWQQRQLIRHWLKKRDVNTFPAPALNADNIIEHYLFLYCREIILYGGVIKEKLSESSITKYSNIEVCFAADPLRYDVAIDHDQLQQWAKRVYEKQESDTHKGLVRYFFRFLSTQALTDHLDIDEFESPCLPPSVDPLRIPLSALHEIVDALLTQRDGSLLQRFYCVVSAIIGYFAMLRRGEVLRLRIKDIRCSSRQPNTFHFIITGTSEGKTKNRTTRSVHTVLPDAMAKLLRIAIQIRKNSPYHSPLIGFEGEKISSRQLYYLLPVTKALKAICGQSARFHHLRKSGIHLLMQQVLQLAYQHPGHELGAQSDLQAMLTPKVIAQRFAYWHEQYEEKDINDNLLFDELCRQIGHQHYATTRWSYLHGAQWLFPYLRPKQSICAQQAFSHAELRFLLGLAPDSNDLSRQLMLLSDSYKSKSVSHKQQNPIILTEHALRAFLWQSSPDNKATLIASDAFKEPNYYYRRWVTTAKNQQGNFVDDLFIKMQRERSLDWSLLSQVWCGAAKHAHSPINKKQRTALSHLGKIALMPAAIDRVAHAGGAGTNLPFLQIQIAGNARNAAHFEAVFRQPEWQWLSCSFALTVNRKTKVARLLALLETRYAKGKEKISVIQQPQGASHLTITLTPTFPVSDSVMKQALQYLTSEKGKTDA